VFPKTKSSFVWSWFSEEFQSKTTRQKNPYLLAGCCAAPCSRPGAPGQRRLPPPQRVLPQLLGAVRVLPGAGPSLASLSAGAAADPGCSTSRCLECNFPAAVSAEMEVCRKLAVSRGSVRDLRCPSSAPGPCPPHPGVGCWGACAPSAASWASPRALPEAPGLGQRGVREAVLWFVVRFG